MTTPDLAGLCERLRELRIILKSGDYDGADLMRAWCAMIDAAAAIESLVAENERMREALKPFAIFAEIISTKNGEPHTPADEDVFPAGPVRWKHLRAARTALQGASDDR